MIFAHHEPSAWHLLVLAVTVGPLWLAAMVGKVRAWWKGRR